MLVLITLLSGFIIFYISKFTLEKILEIDETGRYSRLRDRIRIPQVVGHYVPAALNLSKDFLDSNGYDPVPGDGENGKIFRNFNFTLDLKKVQF